MMVKTKGFYEELEKLREDNPKANFNFLEKIKTKIGMSAIDCLHGLCTVFAYALHKEFGYEIYSIYDEYDGDEVIVHAYCAVPNGEETVYVDVRGYTTDFVLFMDEFNDSDDTTENYCKTLKIRNDTLLAEEAMEDTDIKEEDRPILSAAKEIIRNYENYYKI